MKVVFLDRDGVINIDRKDYVKSWSEFIFTKNAKESLKLLNENGYELIIITNQSSINRNIMTIEELDNIHKRMLSELSDAGARLKDIFICPHKPNELCNCRKPKPGLLMQAMAKYKIERESSYMVGDKWSDIYAGKEAGVKTIQIYEVCENNLPDAKPDYKVSNLYEAAKLIIALQAEQPQKCF